MAHSLTPLASLPLSVSPLASFVRSLARSSTKPHHRCTFARSLASIVPLFLSRSRRSFIPTASNPVPFSLALLSKIETFLQRTLKREPFLAPTCAIGPALFLDAGNLKSGNIHNLSARLRVLSIGAVASNERNANASASKRQSWRGHGAVSVLRPSLFRSLLFLPPIGPTVRRPRPSPSPTKTSPGEKRRREARERGERGSERWSWSSSVSVALSRWQLWRR